MPLSKYQRYAVGIIPLLIVGLIAYYFLDIVTYIVLAWILSMIGAPLFNKLRGVIGESGSALVTLLSFSLITMATIYLFIPPIIQQARNIASIDYQSLGHSLEEPINDWNDWLIEKGILEDHSPHGIGISKDSLAQQDQSTIEVLSIDSILNKRDSSIENVTIVIQVNNQHLENQTLEDAEATLITDTFIERAQKNIFSFLNPTRITKILSGIFGALGNTFIGIMSVFFIAFFFLKEQKLFTSIINTLSPDDQEDKWGHAIDESAQLLKRYFIGIVIQVVIITIFVSAALSFLGLQNALLIGFFAALMNVIPYLGPLLGAAFGIIITLSSNLPSTGGLDQSAELLSGGFYDVLLPKLGLLVLVFGAMQLFDNFIVQPNIFSKSVKAHPLEIFIIILVGAKLGGVLGMVIAIPMYTILRVIAKVFLSEFKIVQRITQRL